jgi:uncharacterized membrane protein
MSDQVSPEVTSDDKLWAALCYPLWFVPIIVLLMDDKKDRPFIKAHAMQALIFGIVLSVVASILIGIIVGCILWPIGVGFQFYWAYQAYNGEYVTIPVITDFVKNQGWA